ncbi:MAG TPA: glycosyltransferase family 39 protein [Candidatus Binataceae bacterium]|nr:glycosyltransferase family 39 protein [Candidatus Binataceae bacterium]
MAIDARPHPRVRLGAQRAVAAAMVAAAIVLSLGIGAPFEKDQEPQSAQWIQAVVHRGEWLLPRDDYGGIDRKPPLYYWLSALAVKAGGARVDEVSARFVALVAGVLLAVAVVRWSAAFLSEATGWLALAFVLGTYGFASRAALGLTDMLLSFLLFATWWCVYLLLEEGGSRAVSIAGGVLLGLAILTKGPVAIVLIGLAGFIYLLLVRRSPLEVLRRGWPWLMIALALAIGACWYVPAFAEGGRVVVGVFLSENFGHFMPSALGGTGEASRPLWYIAARMFGGALPQSLLVAALAIALWRRDGDERVRKPLLFQLSLVLAVLVFFSIASSKRDDYILPAMPGLAILFAALFTGAAIAPGRERSSSGRVRDLTAAVIAAASVALVAGALVMAHQPRLLAGFSAGLQSSDANFLELFLNGMSHLAAPFAIFAIGSIAGALIVFAGLFVRRPLWSGAGLAAIALFGSTLFTGTLKPESARARSMKTFAEQVHRRIGDAPLYIPWGHDYELSFYYGGGIGGLDPGSAPVLASDRPRYETHSGPSVLALSQPVYVVARPRELSRIAPALRIRLKLVMQSGLIGGGGPPALYELAPVTAPAPLNSGVPATK